MVGGQLTWADRMLNWGKAFEEETPLYIGRTFGLTELFSPYVLGTRVSHTIPADIAQKQSSYYEALTQRFVQKQYGRAPDISQYGGGLRLEGGKLYGLKEGGVRELILPYARMRLSTWQPDVPDDVKLPPLRGRMTAALHEILARQRGTSYLGGSEEYPFEVVGGSNRLRSLGRESQALVETYNRRFFKLLDDPLEFMADVGYKVKDFPFLEKGGNLLRKLNITNRFGLGGRYQGNVFQQWGRWLMPEMINSKWRPGALMTFLGAPFLYHAADQFLRSHQELTHDTSLENGLGGFVADNWQRAMMTRAKFGKYTGLSALARTQESIAPGSTDPVTMMGLPLGLGISGALASFAKTRAIDRAGDISQVWKSIWLPTHQFEGVLGRYIKGSYRHAGKWGLAGIAIGIALEAPFIPGTIAHLLGGTKTPEELGRIYQGTDAVPVRHGRFWEMGSCIASFVQIHLFDGKEGVAGDILVGDSLVGKNGRRANVLRVWERHHQGTVLKITTAIDRSLPTVLTDNHIVPAILIPFDKGTAQKRGLKIKEVPAGELTNKHWVEVPIPVLPENNIQELHTADFLKVGKFLEKDGKITTAQINWNTNKLQKSKGPALPSTITITPEFGRLLGYFLAEGNLTYSQAGPTYIETVHAKEEEWIAKDICKIVENLFGFSPTYKLRTDQKLTKDGCWIVRIQSSLLARVFYELFYQSDRKNDKQFPEIIFSFHSDVQMQVVEGYWQGDGCSNVNRIGKKSTNGSNGTVQLPRFLIKSARPKFVRAIQRILLAHGFLPTIAYSDNGFKGSWTLGWNPGGQHVEQQFFVEHKGRLFVKIVSIEEEDYDGQVYDFEVDDKDHLFQAGTFLVHNSDIRGTKPDYFRPHWTVLTKSDYLNKSLFKGDESWLFKAIKRTPILSDIVDPYYLERENYRERPYPVAGPSYPGLGPIGPLYAATIGKLFKPVRLMHAKEWQTPEGLVNMPEENAPDPSLGGLAPGEPESQYGLKRTAAETVHRFTEAIGLPGWLARVATGSEDWGSKEMQYASSERMTSQERSYWDKNLGGLMFSNEWYRRINTRLRYQIRSNLYNPIRNSMPDWLPGPKYFIDFLHGSQFEKIQEGEARLPGNGYAALHPELEGVDPQDYPWLTRLKILGDVAVFSNETRSALARAENMLQSGELTPEEESQVLTVKDQIAQIKQRKEFKDLKDWSEDSVVERGPGKYWETLAHNAEVPWESILPFRPASKFVHARDPLEDYEKAIVYGSDMGYWNRPWEQFIRPAALESIRAIPGAYDDVPENVEKLRDTEEYFDKLKYLRAKMHQKQASELGDIGGIHAWRTQAGRTLVGADPFQNLQSVLMAMPRRERDYFQEFSTEDDPERQTRLLDILPKNLGRVYRLLWESRALNKLDDQEAVSLMDAKEGDLKELRQALINDMSSGSRATPEMLERYQEEDPDAPLNEWLAEQELQEYFQDHNLPNESSLVWDPRVDLEDIKLKVIKSEGQDQHDYDLWESRERLLSRKPYLDTAVADLHERRSAEDIRRQIRAICEGYQIQDLAVEVEPGNQMEHQVMVNLAYDNRQQLSRHLFMADHGSTKPQDSRKASIHHTRPTRRRNERPA